MSKNSKKSNNNYKNTNTTKDGKVKTNLPTGNMRSAPTDYDIPRFGFKSAFFILGAAIISTIIIPLLLQNLGLDYKFVAILANTFITSYSVAYARFFIETKRGYCKRFWYTYAGFALSFFILAFLWIYLNKYI